MVSFCNINQLHLEIANICKGGYYRPVCSRPPVVTKFNFSIFQLTIHAYFYDLIRCKFNRECVNGFDYRGDDWLPGSSYSHQVSPLRIFVLRIGLQVSSSTARGTNSRLKFHNKYLHNGSDQKFSSYSSSTSYWRNTIDVSEISYHIKILLLMLSKS